MNYAAPLGSEGSKNALLRAMLEEGADWLILCEDDVRVTSPEAISGYVTAAEGAGLGHLLWHGGNPKNKLAEENGAISYWRDYPGCWTMFSRKALEDVGLLDDVHFNNAYGHIHLSVRMCMAGYADCRPWHMPDATGSENWLENIPVSTSAATPDEKKAAEGSIWWRQNEPRSKNFLWPQ